MLARYRDRAGDTHVESTIGQCSDWGSIPHRSKQCRQHRNALVAAGYQVAAFYPRVAQSGSASGLGPEGRRFKSVHADFGSLSSRPAVNRLRQHVRWYARGSIPRGPLTLARPYGWARGCGPCLQGSTPCASTKPPKSCWKGRPPPKRELAGSSPVGGAPRWSSWQRRPPDEREDAGSSPARGTGGRHVTNTRLRIIGAPVAHRKSAILIRWAKLVRLQLGVPEIPGRLVKRHHTCSTRTGWEFNSLIAHRTPEECRVNGAVAHLGERLTGSQKAGSSSLPSSTRSRCSSILYGHVAEREGAGLASQSQWVRLPPCPLHAAQVPVAGCHPGTMEVPSSTLGCSSMPEKPNGLASAFQAEKSGFDSRLRLHRPVVKRKDA